jgi:hypothetical protein
LEVSVHAWGAAAVAVVAHGRACAVVHEAECVFVAARCIDFPGGEQLGVLRVEEFVIGEGIREAQEVFNSAIAAAR